MKLGRRVIRSKNVSIPSCHPENGAVVVGCANTHNKSCLETQFKQLDPFEGIRLRLIPARSLVRMCKVTTFVPRTTGTETKDDVTLGLKSQSGLDTDHWTVVGGNTLPERQFLVIHIDEASLQKLRSLGMRPFLGAERITDLCSKDTAVTEVHLRTGDGSIRILFASVYRPYDSVEAPPTTAMRKTVEYRVNKGKHLILELDANAHHVA
nr:unnamed protein product [Callosobruchus analis]